MSVSHYKQENDPPLLLALFWQSVAPFCITPWMTRALGRSTLGQTGRQLVGIGPFEPNTSVCIYRYPGLYLGYAPDNRVD